MYRKLGFAILTMVSALSAAPITGLHNTGASTTGSADNHWTVISPPGAGQVVSPVFVNSAWLPNTADSLWEWVQSDAQPTGTVANPLIYTFRHQFLLSGFNPASVVIAGRWATDNEGLQILVNGQVFNQTSPTYSSWSSFTLNSGFVNGLNVIDFVVKDFGVVGGFRVEFLSAQADIVTPEPATAALAIIALLAAVLYRRRVSPGA